MKNTNTAAFRATVWTYLIGTVYDYEGEDSEAARAAYIAQRFSVEYNYPENRRRVPSLQDRVAEWLSGLSLNIDYTYADIIARAEAWHECKLTENQADTVCDRWFSFLAFKLIQLWQHHGIKVEY